MISYKWHKYKDERPKEYGKYLVCDQFGHITMKTYREKHTKLVKLPKEKDTYWQSSGNSYKTIEIDEGFTKTSSRDSELATNVYWWAEIPAPPKELSEVLRTKKILDLENKIKRLKAELSGIKKGCEDEYIDTDTE